MRNIWERLAIWAALLALVAITAPAASAASQGKKRPAQPNLAPAPASQHYVLATFNMAGGNPDYGDQSPIALALSASIKNNDADIVFLQETCRNMTDLLALTLGSGWTVRFLDTAGARCKGGGASAFGIGIVVRTSIGTPLKFRSYLLPSSGFEQRKLLCVDTSTPPMFACSTHLTSDEGKAGDKSRLLQTEQIAKLVSMNSKAGEAAFIGGDFNTTPMSFALDSLWHTEYENGAGSFLEVASPGFDRGAGGATFPGFPPRKIDYIFVRDVSVTGSAVVSSSYSDHDQLWAIVDR